MVGSEKLRTVAIAPFVFVKNRFPINFFNNDAVGCSFSAALGRN